MEGLPCYHDPEYFAAFEKAMPILLLFLYYQLLPLFQAGDTIMSEKISRHSEKEKQVSALSDTDNQNM